MAPNDDANYWITNIANYCINYNRKYRTSCDISMTKIRTLSYARSEASNMTQATGQQLFPATRPDNIDTDNPTISYLSYDREQR